MSAEPSGELIPFPPRDDEPHTIPVDRPPTAEEVLIGRVIRSATAQRRPIIPGWLRARADFWSAVRRIAVNDAHRLAYHLSRAPLYAARTTLRAPRGAWNVAARAHGWAFDAEGRPLRSEAARRGNAEDYLRLRRVRDDRVRLRLLIVGLVLLGLLLAGVLTSIYAPPGAGWAALVAVLVALGIIGSAPDRPMFERAVVSAASPKLTSHVVVEALGARGRLAQLSAPERRTGPVRSGHLPGTDGSQ